MATKTTEKKINGNDVTNEKKSQKVTDKKISDVTTAADVVSVQGTDPIPIEPTAKQPIEVVTKKTNTSVNGKPKAKAKTKTASVAPTSASKKAVGSKEHSIGIKKIKLASTCYHYYRNWLKEWMRAHGAPSARFAKSPESYDGHITVIETEKAKGVKALEQWVKENPGTKETFWDLKK